MSNNNIDIPTSPSKLNILLDASKLDTFETCPEKFNYRYNLNRGLPSDQKAKPLDRGSVIHAGFERYYSLLAQKIRYKERIEETKIVIGAMLADVNQSNLNDDEGEIILNTVEQNLDYWRSDDENCLEIIAVEQSFVYLVYSTELLNFYMTGKIDLLCNYHGIGRNSSYTNLVIDHKSFERDSNVLRKSNQFTNYAIACDTAYILVNRVGLYAKSSKKTNEERFKRVPLSYDPIYKNDWKNNVGALIEQEYIPAVISGVWPEKATSCNKFNRLCDYYSVCDTSGEDTKVFKLANEFVDAEVWDVSAKLEGE